MFESEIQILIGGLLLGGIYAIVAFGLSVIYGVSRVLNLAHGDLLMLGAFITFFIFSHFEINPFLILVILIPLFFVIGSVFEKSLIRPLMKRPLHTAMVGTVLVTLGVALALEDVTFYFTKTDVGVSYYLPSVNIANITISSVRLAALILVMLLAVSLHILLKKTLMGKAIRAVTEDKESSIMVGINISRVSMVTFGIGTALAATGGLFFIMISTASSFIGLPWTVKALMIIILGGLGSLLGSLAGGLILGLAENFTAYYIGIHWSPQVALIMLLVILVIRPRGLFGIPAK